MRFGPQQREPLGNGSEGERCDPGGLRMQMVPWLLEGEDGELPLSPDHFWQCGPSAANCTSQGRAFEDRPQSGPPPSLRMIGRLSGFFFGGKRWRIIPVSKWLITIVVVSSQDLGL